MYLAIEGIKGTGKSTILDHITEKEKNSVSFFPITKPVPVYNQYESLSICHPYLNSNDFFCENLFAQRAKWHQQHLAKGKLIIGDRSLLTSYVTRWSKWGDPFYTIRRSQMFHQGIKHPDVIVWLKSKPENSIERLKQRPAKPLGTVDEKHIKLKEAADIYEELLLEKLYIKKVAKAQVILLSADESLGNLVSEVHSIIKFYKN